jgi:hypothetical protein
MIIHTLYDQRVHLDVEAHKYFDSSGLEYMGFSSLYQFLAPKFNANFIAKHVAKSENTTADAILNKWQSATDEGTRIDAALELYAQTGRILDENADLEPVIKHILMKYKDYHRCYEQLVVYSEKYRTAGSLDKIGIMSNRKDSRFHLIDFKCFVNGMSYEPKGQAWLNPPFDYLPNTKYTKINFQTSYYTWHFEQLTGRKCERIFVDMIRPVKDSDGKIVSYNNSVIPMPYLKPQIELLLETYKDTIINLLDPVAIDQEESF